MNEIEHSLQNHTTPNRLPNMVNIKNWWLSHLSPQKQYKPPSFHKIVLHGVLSGNTKVQEHGGL